MRLRGAFVDTENLWIGVVNRAIYELADVEENSPEIEANARGLSDYGLRISAAFEFRRLRDYKDAWQVNRAQGAHLI